MLPPWVRARNLMSGGPYASPTSFASSRTIFFKPLIHISQGGRTKNVCMLLEPQLCRRTVSASMLKKGYVMIQLAKGKRAAGLSSIYEAAHRLVLWCMRGPPPSDGSKPLVMHTCDSPRCVSPACLAYGSHFENHPKRRREEEEQPSTTSSDNDDDDSS